MVWSPWVEISDKALIRYANSALRRVDRINVGFAKWGKEAYEPLKRTEESDEYLAPVGYPFETQTPLFVQVGSAELLYDEVRAFSERMSGVEGNRICLVEIRDAPHDIILTGRITGFGNEVEVAVKEAVRFFGLF